MLVRNKNSSEFNTNQTSAHIKSTFTYDSKTDSKCNNSDDDQPSLPSNKACPVSTAVPVLPSSTGVKRDTIVDAVVLHRAGLISQIKFDTSATLKQASIILDGQPTIIGEFESLGVIIVRPVHNGCCCKYGQNKHRLPFPFQNEKYCGDYLLYKIDSACVAQDFTAEEYRAFELQMRDKTTAAYLKMSVKSKETSSNVGKLWEKENIISAENNVLSVEKFNNLMTEALANVRRIGRADGQKLASSLTKTFYDVHGRDPELNEMTNIFRSVKRSLANDESIDEEDVDDDGTAEYMEDKISVFNDADGKDLVEYAMRFVTEDLISRARETFFITNGRRPNSYELRFEMLDLFQSSVIDSQTTNASISLEIDGDYDPENKSDQEILVTDDHIDEEYEKELEMEVDGSAVQLLTTPLRTKKNSAGYDLYFDESPIGNLDKAKDKFASMHKRLPTDAEIENIREFLTPVNVDRLAVAEFDVLSNVGKISDENADKKSESSVDEQQSYGIVNGVIEDDVKMVDGSMHVLTTPVKKRANCAGYSLYFDDDEQNEQNCERGLEWFKKILGRNPTAEEMANLSEFVSTDKSVLFDEEVNIRVPAFDDEEDDYVVDVD